MYNHLYIFAKIPIEFIFSLARVADVSLKKVRKAQKGCSFYIPNKDFDSLKTTLEKHGKEYHILKDYSIKSFFARNFVRYGFFVGIAIALIVMIFYSVNATRLQIGGNKLVDTQTISNTVAAVAPLPMKKSYIDKQEIIKKLVALEGISNASVALKGNTLIVNVYEELAKVEVLDTNDFSPVLSKYDALITRIVTYSGSAAVKKGQAVKSGDKLIVPDIAAGEGVFTKEKPLGDIYGRVWYTKSIVIMPTIMVNERTGNIETYTHTFFNKSKEYSGKFVNYEKVSTTYMLPSIIPLRIYRQTYYETVSKEIEFSYDRNKEGIIKENTQMLESELPQEAIKLRTWHIEKRVDKIVYLDIYYEVEMKIN